MWQGAYHSLNSLDDARREELKAEGLYFEPPDMATLMAGAGAAPYHSDLTEWPDHRGVYRSKKGNLAVLLNEEDHLRIVVHEQVRLCHERLSCLLLRLAIDAFRRGPRDLVRACACA